MDAVKRNILALAAQLDIFLMDLCAMLAVARPIAPIETARLASIITPLNLLKDFALFTLVLFLLAFRVTMHLMDFILMGKELYKYLTASLIMGLTAFNAKDIDSQTHQYYMGSAIPTIASHLHSSTAQTTAWQTSALLQLPQVLAWLQIA